LPEQIRRCSLQLTRCLFPTNTYVRRC
jgi:hypothetical protein